MSLLDAEQLNKCRNRLARSLHNHESRPYQPKLDLNWIPSVEEYLGKYVDTHDNSISTENLVSTIRTLLKVGMVIFGAIINTNPAGITIEIKDILYCSTVDLFTSNQSTSFRRDNYVAKTIQNLNKNDRKSLKNEESEILPFEKNGINFCTFEKLKYLFKQLKDQALLAFCSQKEFDGIPPDRFVINQHISAVIIANADKDRIQLSLKQRHLHEHILIELGPCPTPPPLPDSENPGTEPPVLLRKGEFNQFISEHKAFTNPYLVEELKNCFSIQQHSSLFPTSYHTIAPFTQLRNDQTKMWLSETVEKGVILSKEGRDEEAIQYYDEALKIDEKYLDAIVAKGAALANLKHYEKALKQLEIALEIDSNHVNARVYYERIKEKLKPPVEHKKPKKSSTEAVYAALLSDKEKSKKSRKKHKKSKKDDKKKRSRSKSKDDDIPASKKSKY